MVFNVGYNSKSSISKSVLQQSDVDRITDALVQSLTPLLGKTLVTTAKNHNIQEEFSTGSMEKIAKALIQQSNEKKTNFTSLGNSTEIKKNLFEINTTLDLLKNLND